MSSETAASTDPRYPIGRFAKPTTITEVQRAQAIQSIAEMPVQLRAAVRGWTDAQLDTPYREGGWTARQLIHHIADSHAQAAVRLRKALTEPNPTVQPYDEKAWADLPDETGCSVEPSLAVLDGTHARWSFLLLHLSPEQWQRTLVHPETGEWTVDALTQLYAWHARHHLAHIVALKRAQGW